MNYYNEGLLIKFIITRDFSANTDSLKSHIW